MSNVIKNGNYTYTEQPATAGQAEHQPIHLTIRVPLLDTGCTAEQMRRKMIEELDELLDEFSAEPVNLSNAFEELHDVVQTMAGFMMAAQRDTRLSEIASITTRACFEAASNRHERKMMERVKERGWTVIRG